MCLIQSCFFSSRLMMRISPMSVVKKCFNTVEPKLPVPPVITSVFPLKASVILFITKLVPLFPSSFKLLTYLFRHCAEACLSYRFLSLFIYRIISFVINTIIYIVLYFIFHCLPIIHFSFVFVKRTCANFNTNTVPPRVNNCLSAIKKKGELDVGIARPRAPPI